MSLTDIQHVNWDSTIVAGGPVVVEFWHENCPTCKKIEQTVRELPTRIGVKAKLVRLNVMESKENRRLAIEKGVIGTPTFKVYCRGDEIGEIVGLETLTNLAGTIENILKDCT